MFSFFQRLGDFIVTAMLVQQDKRIGKLSACKLDQGEKNWMNWSAETALLSRFILKELSKSRKPNLVNRLLAFPISFSW